MKALFVDCLNTRKKESWREAIPIAPRRVCGILEKIGVDFEFMHFYEFKRKRKECRKFNLLLVSGMRIDLNNVRAVSKIWSKYSAGYKIIGGPIATDFNVCFRNGFDFAIIGEGEIALQQLFRINFDMHKLRDVPNLVFKKDSRIFFSERRFCKVKEIIEINNYNQVVRKYPLYFASKVYVEVVRGCSNFLRPKIGNCIKCGNCESEDLKKRLFCPVGIPPGCGYCSVPSFFGPARSLPASYIVEEVKELIKIGVRRIFLEAPDFLDYGREQLATPLTNPKEPPANLKAIKKLLSSLFKLKEVKDRKASINVENIKANLLTEDVADLLGSYLRGTSLNLGCETGSEKHCKKIGRPFGPKDVLKAIKLLRKNGIFCGVYFIYGLPFQSRETVFQTISMIKKCVEAGAEKIHIYKFLPLKGTAFENFRAGNPKEKLNKLLIEFVNEINFQLKKKLVGCKLPYIIAQKIKKNRYFAYPLKRGPNVIAKGKFRVGSIVLLKLLKALGPNLMLAKAKK